MFQEVISGGQRVSHVQQGGEGQNQKRWKSFFSPKLLSIQKFAFLPVSDQAQLWKYQRQKTISCHFWGQFISFSKKFKLLHDDDDDNSSSNNITIGLCYQINLLLTYVFFSSGLISQKLLPQLLNIEIHIIIFHLQCCFGVKMTYKEFSTLQLLVSLFPLFSVSL